MSPAPRVSVKDRMAERREYGGEQKKKTSPPRNKGGKSQVRIRKNPRIEARILDNRGRVCQIRWFWLRQGLLSASQEERSGFSVETERRPLARRKEETLT